MKISIYLRQNSVRLKRALDGLTITPAAWPSIRMHRAWKYKNKFKLMLSHANHRLVLKKLTVLLMETKALKNLLRGDSLESEADLEV